LYFSNLKSNIMTTAFKKQCITMLLLSSLMYSQAQDRAQDNNSSRSNKTASTEQSDDWTFGVITGVSSPIKSNEGSLFRGNSMATKLFGRYHFGNVGLGISSGFVPGSINSTALNTFLTERKFQQEQIIKSNPFNSYLLFGPSFRFGNRIMVVADIQGGMFTNNPGSISIAQAGTNRTLYRFEASDKNFYPGFSANISLAYPVNNSTRFVINTGYLHSKSSIRMYDPQQGMDIPVDQEHRLRLFVVGIGITKSFGATREAGSGMATGKKHIGNVKYENRIGIGSEYPAEKIIAASQRHAINTNGTAATNGRMMNNESCGPVTQTITNADGTTEAISFACADDAAAYNERRNKTVTVPKQTQGATFGEKVNAGMHAAGSALRQGTSRGVISGRVSWSANNSAGIITNQDAVSSVGQLAGAAGGAAAASYAATGLVIAPSTSSTGIAATIYSREAGSGMATGRRSSRDAGSGMATGRRQYQAVYNEGETNTCNDCPVTVKLMAHELTHVVQQAQAQNNPLYNDNGHQGTNPLFEGKRSLRPGEDQDCDGVANLNVHLIDINSGAVVANTKTTSCGEFFFANVPSASYLVKVTGAVSKTKIYEATVNSEGKVDLAGEITLAYDHWVIQLNTENDNTQTAGMSTSRSNIRTHAINIIETDPLGTGEFAPVKVVMEFTDGSSIDVTAFSKINSTAGNKKVTVRGWDVKKKEKQVNNPNSITEYSILLPGSHNETTLTSQYDNGSKKETRVLAAISSHPNVIQWIIPVDDMNTEATEAVIKTKTKSNQSNDRMANATNGRNNNSKSYTKELPIFIGDMDNDGISEILTGNAFAASNVIGQGASILGGALPGGAVISAFARPGNPIGGIIVKGGRNPGGSLRTTQTNEQGEFEFTGMEKGNYSISTEVVYYMNDETIVTVGEDGDDNNDVSAERKGWDGSVKGGSKTEVKVDEGLAARKGWDGSVKGGSKMNVVEDNSASVKSSAQHRNSSRSNKTASLVDNSAGDATSKSIVNTTKSNTKDFLIALDELEQLLNADKTTSASAIHTVKENSRSLRSSYQKMENSFQNTVDIERAAIEADTHLAVLLASINTLGQRYNSISNVLKTKHDAVK
jgi:hypothetical protein